MQEPTVHYLEFDNPAAFPTYRDKVFIPKEKYKMAEETKDFIILEPNN